MYDIVPLIGVWWLEVSDDIMSVRLVEYLSLCGHLVWKLAQGRISSSTAGT